MKLLAASLLLAAASGPEPLEGHPAGVQQVAFSPDGSLLAAGGSAAVVTVWDAGTRTVRRTLQGAGHQGSVTFSPDSRFLSSGSSDGKVRVWNLVTGDLTAAFDHVPPRLPATNVYAVAYSPDGARLASGGGEKSVIRLWNPAANRLDRSFGTYGSAIFCLAFSPDGAQLLAGSEDGKLRIFSCDSGLSLFDVAAHAGGVRTVAISPDGKTVATGGVDRVARLWDFAEGRLRERKSLCGHSDMVLGVAFSRDGKELASAAPDGTVRTWEVARGLAGKIAWRGPRGARSVAYGPDGRMAFGFWSEPNVLLDR